MDKNFTAEDIKAGYLGVFEDGTVAIAINVGNNSYKYMEFVAQEQIKDGRNAYISCAGALSDDETRTGFKLVALYGYATNYTWFSTDNRPLLWQREKPATEMTIAEIEEKLGVKNLKIVKADS